MTHPVDPSRPLAARWIAGLLALCGSCFAAMILPAMFTSPGLLALMLPGWFAFFALIWAASGRHLRGDPWATWLPCLLVNAYWLASLGWRINLDDRETLLFFFTRIYTWAAVAGGAIGLGIELARQSTSEGQDPAPSSAAATERERPTENVRCVPARWIAAALFLGGLYAAVVIYRRAFESSPPLAVAAPAVLALAALASAALGKRLPGDPWTTWLACILSSAIWLSVIGFDFGLAPAQTFDYFYLRIYLLAAAGGGALGLLLDTSMLQPEKSSETTPSE